MSIKLPKCELCKHFNEEKMEDYCCDAFPEGIPLEAMIADKTAECNDGIKYEHE